MTASSSPAANSADRDRHQENGLDLQRLLAISAMICCRSLHHTAWSVWSWTTCNLDPLAVHDTAGQTLYVQPERKPEQCRHARQRSRRIWVRWQTLSQSDAPARKRSALCRTRPSVRLDKTSWRQAEPSGLNERHLSIQEVLSQFIISHVPRNPSVQSSSRSMQSDLAFLAATLECSSGS